MSAVITVIECPFHHVRGLCIGSTRITGAMCCGCWNEVERFVIVDSPEDVMDLLTDDILERDKPHA